MREALRKPAFGAPRCFPFSGVLIFFRAAQQFSQQGTFRGAFAATADSMRARAALARRLGDGIARFLRRQAKNEFLPGLQGFVGHDASLCFFIFLYRGISAPHSIHSFYPLSFRRCRSGFIFASLCHVARCVYHRVVYEDLWRWQRNGMAFGNGRAFAVRIAAARAGYVLYTDSDVIATVNVDRIYNLRT